jgi:hypothetical protein
MNRDSFKVSLIAACTDIQCSKFKKPVDNGIEHRCSILTLRL